MLERQGAHPICAFAHQRGAAHNCGADFEWVAYWWEAEPEPKWVDPPLTI